MVGVMNWLNLALRVKDAEIRYLRGGQQHLNEFRQALIALKEEVDSELLQMDSTVQIEHIRETVDEAEEE